MQFIDIKKQYQLHKTEILKAVHDVLEEGTFILGKPVFDLEKALADYVGMKHCITVASGTDSLEVALMAKGIGPGDEVITTPFTFIATAEAVALVGATPVFVDIDPLTYNLDISQIEKKITKNTKALIPVSLFGQMPDYDKINAIGKKYHLFVMEDGAQSFGATRKGKKSLGVTEVSSTSFFPAKPFGCYGDGGALFTNDDALANEMRAIRTHGGLVRDRYTRLGFNARFDTLQAAILLAKLPHFDGEVNARRRLGARYSELLKEHVVTPIIEEGNTHVYAQYTVRVRDRDAVRAKLQEQGIPTAVYYPNPLHVQPVFTSLGYKLGDFPETEKAAKEVLSLPMHPWLEEKEQDKVVEALIQAVEECSLATSKKGGV